MYESQIERIKKGFGNLKVGAITVRDPKKVRKVKRLPTLEEGREIERSLIFIDPEANDRFVDLLMAPRKSQKFIDIDSEAHDRFVDLLMATR